MKLSLCITLMAVCLQLAAQRSFNDSMKQRIDSLGSLIREKNYTRIPITDLDKALDVKVQSEVSAAVNKYLAILGVLLFGGVLGIYNLLKGEIRNQVDTVVKERIDDLKKQLFDLKQDGKTDNDRQNVLIQNVHDNVNTLSAKQDLFFKEVSKNVEKEISEATATIWTDIADNKLRTAKETKNYTGSFAKDLNDFIANDTIKIPSEKKRLLIDELIRYLYYTPQTELKDYDFGEKSVAMGQIINKYETDLDLLADTYANAAIILNNYYEQYRNPDDKKLCINFCDKALLKLKDYGIPFILKMELFSMDYVKAYDQHEKDESLDQLRRLFHIINSSRPGPLHHEAVYRIQIDKKLKMLKPYIELLDNICHIELLKLYSLAMQYYDTKDTLNAELFKQAFTGILSDRSSKYATIMNGQWNAIKSLKGGVAADLQSSSIEFIITGHDIILKVGKTESLGYIYYVNDEDPQAIDLFFYDQDKKIVLKAYCISMINDQGVWTLCANYNSDTRPVDFVSDSTNNFYLEEFAKA